MSEEPRSSTETIIGALRVLANDIQSKDGIANACCYEASCRLEELQAELSELRKAGEWFDLEVIDAPKGGNYFFLVDAVNNGTPIIAIYDKDSDTFREHIYYTEIFLEEYTHWKPVTIILPTVKE